MGAGGGLTNDRGCDDMTEPAVTVGIPAHNNARTLARAIASVKGQAFAGWRLILSDDRSSDETWSICKEAERSDARITAMRQPEQRMFMNFGDLLKQAETPFFAWLAADDYWAPDFLRSCLAGFDRDPSAVSVLPRCEYIAAPRSVANPGTESLDGPVTERLRRYLAHPGGTRMYGLMRTDVAKQVFPPRNMNAYDWYLMVGLLNRGPQLEVPVPLLYRELTDWMRYAEMVDELYSSRLFRRFPVLDLSLQILRRGWVPAANLRDLLAMNLRKHEEYLLVTRPDQFSRRTWLFRRLGLPLSTRAVSLTGVAADLVRKGGPRAAGAVRVLEQEMRRGTGVAGIALGNLRRDGVIEGDPLECYEMAAESGSPDGQFYAARWRLERRQITEEAGWPLIIGAVHRGSEAARDHVESELASGKLSQEFAEVARRILGQPPGNRHSGGQGAA